MLSTTTNNNWFHIQYTESAPRGLPPVVQADQVIRYSDDSGAWVVALWRHVSLLGGDTASCILRVEERHVAASSQHDDMASAAAEMAIGAPRTATKGGAK